MTKKIIALDIDDVLAANAEGFAAFSNERYGMNLSPEDYDEHWAEVWKVDMAEANRRADEFHDSGALADYRHFDEALPVLKSLAKDYELIAITARRRSVEQVTRDWMEKYYEGIFTDVYFAGIWDAPLDLGMLNKTKADLFVSNKVRYVIDDQLKHCLAAAELGIDTILFGNYSWNQATPLPKNLTRCNDWQAVGEYFEKQRA